MRKILKFLGVVAVVSLAASILTATAPALVSEAADASQFDPGNIITNELFFNGEALSPIEIQQFLVNQVPVCRSSYACLSTYRQNTPTMAAVSGRCGGYDGRNNESAAYIIYRVGLACGISSKAMLVLLEKEQSLVTSATPSQGRFNAATGMGCPDTAPCDPSFGGFFYQVYYAARQFKAYAANPSAWNYQSGRVNNILYHPNRDCGTSPVYIANQATAGLYNYTPYQPNAAALNNLYGTGDGCSAYGNRNFWRIYTDWFGSTQANTEGALAIARLYSSLGGAGSKLGAQLSGVVCSSNYQDCGVVYRLGSIYWSNRTGAWPVYESIRGAYWNAGGSAGALGAPITNPISISANGGGIGQVFEHGSIYSSPSAGSYPVYEPVRAAYFQTSGAAGSFGWPTGNQTCSSTGYGCTQPFQNGYVGSRGLDTAFFVKGQFALSYRAAGGPAGSLGVVASGEIAIPQNGGGTGQAFESGSIYSSKISGIFPVVGNVRNGYFTVGGSSGSLGWPTGIQACSVVRTGCIQAFQNGFLSATSPKSFQIISGRIASAYSSSGGTTGPLGIATSSLISIPQNGGGSSQVFEGGAIYDSPALGTFSVPSSVRAEYQRFGGPAGSLGWPTANQICGLIDSGCWQTFQNMTIFTSHAGVMTVSNRIAPGYADAGGVGGLLGTATSELISIPQNGGGIGQAFKGGSVFVSQAGSFAVSGGIRDRYFRQAGAAGALGWPSGSMNCSFPNGACSQSFQNGTLFASAAGTFVVSGSILTAYSSLGGLKGTFGLPTSSVIPITGNGGGTGQVFQRGSIYSSVAGSFGVSGAIRDEYFRQGGALGALGWPSGPAICSAPGPSCTQKFQHGSIAR